MPLMFAGKVGEKTLKTDYKGKGGSAHVIM